MAISINDYLEQHRKRAQYEQEMMMREYGGLGAGFGLGVAAGYVGMQAQQAAAVPPPKPDPQTNPVLLLTGDDQ